MVSSNRDCRAPRPPQSWQSWHSLGSIWGPHWSLLILMAKLAEILDTLATPVLGVNHLHKDLDKMSPFQVFLLQPQLLFRRSKCKASALQHYGVPLYPSPKLWNDYDGSNQSRKNLWLFTKLPGFMKDQLVWQDNGRSSGRLSGYAEHSCMETS